MHAFAHSTHARGSWAVRAWIALLVLVAMLAGEQSASGQTPGSGAINIAEQDGSPRKTGAKEIRVSNGSLAINPDGSVTINTDGSGNDGWTPVFAVIADGARRVLQVSDWTGGEGTKPATGLYVGASGLTATLASAVDIRGAAGPAGADSIVPGPGYGGTSTSSVAIGPGEKTFATQSGLAYIATASRVRVAAAANPAYYVEGVVSSYSGSTLVVSVDSYQGSGTVADWTISLAGEPAANGVVVNHGDAGPSETIDLSAGKNHTITLDQASCAITLTGAAADGRRHVAWVRYIQGSGNNVITYAAGSAPEGTAPTLSTAAGSFVDVCYVTDDGGSHWYASGGVTTAVPSAHATTHQSGGSDAVKLDDLAIPDDNTDLNVSTGRHGLFPKLPGGSTNFYREDGTWQPVGGSSHNLLSSTHSDTTTGSVARGDLLVGDSTPKWVRKAAPSLVGSVVWFDGSDPQWLSPLSFFWREEFIRATGGEMQTNTSGAAAASAVGAGDATHPGIWALSTGTDTTGSAGVRTATNSILLGGLSWDMLFVVRLAALSDGTDTYSVRVGLNDNTTGAATDGVYFEYASTVDANWRGITASNGTRTTASGGSTVAVDTNWAVLRITVNAAGTSASFYVWSGSAWTLVGTSAANIPTGTGRETGWMCHIVKSAGTTARTLAIDKTIIAAY